MKAIHFSLEGVSGAGKSTQAKILVEKLRSEGVKVAYVKNPNGTIFGKTVMTTILSESPCGLAEVLAFASCFCQSVNELILPLLSEGICVVSDRGIGSAYAHAMYRCRGVISEDCFMKIMTEIDNGNAVFPDLTFLLSLPIEKGAERKEKCSDKSQLDVINPGSIREASAYNYLSKKFSQWINIDADNDIDTVSQQIWTYAKEIIKGG